MKSLSTLVLAKPSSDLTENCGTYLISFAVLSERFSFWGLQAILVIFLVQYYSQSEVLAFSLIGTFGALSYTFSLLGGLLADKLFGSWKACVLGLGLCFLGNLILIFSHTLFIFNLGLAFILVGAGLFSPNSNNLIRTLYANKPDLKESAFLVMCIAGNVSGALAPIIYGLFGAKGHWKEAFVISVLFNFIALFLFYRYLTIFQAKTLPAKYRILEIIIPSFLIGISFSLLMYVNVLNVLLAIASVPFTLFASWLYYQLNLNERAQVKFIIFLMTILLLFYVAVFQIYSSLTVFIAHSVNRMVMGWEMPIAAFAALQCIFFIICAPIVRKILTIFKKTNGVEPSILVRIPVGLLIGVVGFLLFAMGEWVARTSGYCGAVWLIAGNFFLGLGEVCLYPPILAAISTFSPQRWSGTFMGAFSLALALSSFFAGHLAKVIKNIWVADPTANISILHLGYARIALYLVAVLIICTIVFAYLQQWYNKQQKILIQEI